MAVVWAKQAGNWTDTTLWAFWNESTQQIEDYGQVPQSGDVVYLNGYTLTSYLGTGFSIKELRNDLNPYTSNIGGVFQIAQQNKAFTFDIYAESLIINSTGMWGNAGLIFNGNIKCIDDTFGGNLISLGNANGLISINGNVNINNAILFGSTYTGFKLAINGNVSASQNGKLIDGTTAYGTLTINGFTQAVANNIPFTTITISGDLKLQDGNILRGTNISINGQNCHIGTNSAINGTNISVSSENITYKNGSLGVCGFISTNPLSFTNVKHFTNVSEPNLLPYVILTDYEINNTQQYPQESDVKHGVPYVWGQKVGTYTPNYPPESVVLKDFEYGDSDDRKTGTMVQEVNIEVGCVTPEDVRKDVPLVGMGVVGSLVVPSVDDVREGVVFDNGSVGTLIVQGGGDRLRIADFGYYTNAQSDTYIVDLTEQDKPKFAVAEERVLIEMFPDLDFDNIPDKYFDDLFVKYLKYRLIVEYYRTAGINSTFTPSEPTTEIVNYQNVRNEVWLNSANIYLKAWGKKYPNSIKEHRIIL